MNEYLSPILLKDELVFNGTIDQLNEKIRLDNNKNFRTVWIEYNKFKFIANWSLGTLIVRGFPKAADGIKGYAELKKIGENKTKVVLRTEVRIELYLILIILAIVTIGNLIIGQEFPVLIFLLVLAFTIWFWFVYRLQEKILFNKLKKYLTN
ncbi:hypothetical protein ACFSQJ_17730 [Croceitalea marina]|uniref:Uncharacterized protein n=1 Tax=Croceitalea marina TaxID=1775166 RepID=A0ABW5N114_9FLAO